MIWLGLMPALCRSAAGCGAGIYPDERPDEGGYAVSLIRRSRSLQDSIALVEGGEPLVGCVADPVRGELFSAARGLGARCNGRALSVGSPQRLLDAVAATVFPKPHAVFMPTYLQQLGHVLGAVAGARRSGGMALDLAYLAAGRIDLFWERGMGSWDAAAGVLLVREAGGDVFTLDGLPWMQSEQIAAATPSLSNAWRELLAR